MSKTCGCGRAHDAAGWRALVVVGYCGASNGEASQRLELRQCPCGSTLAVDVPVESVELRVRWTP